MIIISFGITICINYNKDGLQTRISNGVINFSTSFFRLSFAKPSLIGR